LRALGPERVGKIELIPGSGGVFEVRVDGRLVYSKKETGQHADLDALAAKIGGWADDHRLSP
jgi:selenoprotein W-related protein